MNKTLDFDLEVKSVEDDGIIEGFASTYSVDQGNDRVMPGAFMESLVKAKKDGRKIPMNWDHNPAEPIGLWQQITETPKGLFVRGQLLKDAVRRAGEVYALLKAGAINGLSIGYRIAPDGAAPDERRPGITKLTKIDLREISLVGMPMNVEARVTSVKSYEGMEWWPLHDQLRELEGADDETIAKAMKEIEDKLHTGNCPKSIRPFFAKRLVGGRSESDRAPRRGEPEGQQANKPADFMRALLGKVG